MTNLILKNTHQGMDSPSKKRKITKVEVVNPVLLSCSSPSFVSVAPCPFDDKEEKSTSTLADSTYLLYCNQYSTSVDFYLIPMSILSLEDVNVIKKNVYVCFGDVQDGKLQVKEECVDKVYQKVQQHIKDNKHSYCGDAEFGPRRPVLWWHVNDASYGADSL